MRRLESAPEVDREPENLTEMAFQEVFRGVFLLWWSCLEPFSPPHGLYHGSADAEDLQQADVAKAAAVKLSECND